MYCCIVPSLTFAIVCMITRMLDESLRWLVSNGRITDAKRILKKAARWNNVDYATIEAIFDENVHMGTITSNKPLLPVEPKSEKDMNALVEGCDSKSVSTTATMVEKSDVSVTDESSVDTNSSGKGVEKYTVLDILRNPALRVNTLILWYTW